MDLKTSLVKDRHRCFCANLSWLPPSAKRSKSYIPPAADRPWKPCGSTFLRGACPTSASCHHRLRNFPFFSSHYSFCFARSCVVGFRHSRVRASFGCPEVFICESIFIGFAGFLLYARKPFASLGYCSRVQHGCRLRRLSRLGRCSTYCSSHKCSLSATTAVSTCIRHWSRDMQRCRDNQSAVACLTVPSRGARLRCSKPRSTRVWIPCPPLSLRNLRHASVS
jgi:hypothetical protein